MDKITKVFIFLFFVAITLTFVSCVAEPYEKKIYPIEQSLKIQENEGLKFEGPSITDGSQFNFKVMNAGQYELVIKDHFKNTISKSILDIQYGDNIMTFYTNAILDGDYTVEFIKNNEIVRSQKITIQ